MKHNIPGPIARKLLALGGCIGALIIFGIVWAIATSDKTILMLSLALLITGTLKGTSKNSVQNLPFPPNF